VTALAAALALALKAMQKILSKKQICNPEKVSCV
jgi:hypothetical protein